MRTPLRPRALFSPTRPAAAAMHFGEDVGAFASALGELYERNRGDGSVWLTVKRTAFKSKAARRKAKRAAMEAGLSRAQVAAAAASGGADEGKFACLVRATDGDKKISLTVRAAQRAHFQSTLAALMRERASALKKRDRTKDKAAKKRAKR